MEEVVSIEDRHYILAGSSLGDPRILVLKDDLAFGIFGSSGDMDAAANRSHGLYKDDMRYCSRLEVRLQGRRPLALSSSVTADNTRIVADLTNPDLVGEDGHIGLHSGHAYLFRSKYMAHGSIFERFVLVNFGKEARQFTVSFSFDADYADIFEVRGVKRHARGEMLEPHIKGDNVVVLAYKGLDGVLRRTQFEFDPAPEKLAASSARYTVPLEPGQRREFLVTVRADPQVGSGPADYARARQVVRRGVRTSANGFAKIHSSNEQLTRWAHRSYADVRMLLTPTETGLYPFAGIPWYSTPFGRDGIITAIQLAWLNPDVAQGALRFLAEHQATEVDEANDAEPGKILHEFRNDEMSNLREVPFGRYYGTIDATPLFVSLAGEYYSVSGDIGFIESLWPNIQRALDWMDRFGDIDGDGFIEYQRKREGGLVNPGWKDANDSVFHADGTLARAPVALCEVQGYVYDAKLQASRMATALGLQEQAEELQRQACLLKKRFHEIFWEEELGMYALALDGEKRPCAVRASNPGHCLFTGIAEESAARRIADAFLSPAFFSGWGVRTVAAEAPRYNPMSYHNGSIWPHDNAIVMAGLARYGFHQHVLELFSAWMDVSEYVDLHRLPELFCGFPRRPGIGPTLYPVACSPQAWAAGAVFMMLQACLGLRVDGVRETVRIRRPRLPDHVDQLSISKLRVGSGMLSLLFHREADDVGVLVQGRKGDVKVMVEK